MASRKDIEEQIMRRAEAKGCTVNWKALALRLLEWQSNIYPGKAPSIIESCMRKPRDEEEAD